MTFFGLVFSAIIIEGIITYVKTFVVDGNFKWQMLAGVVIGILVALAYNIDLFAMAGLTSVVPFVGCILTGVLISRGSNYVFDLIKNLQTTKTDYGQIENK